MYTFESEPLPDDRGVRVCPTRDGLAISYGDVLELWQADATFIAVLTEQIRASRSAGVRWETPPLSTATLDRPFEYVLLDAPGLVGRPDPTAFAAPLAAAPPTSTVATFPNLGHDATLVVPRPIDPAADYGHLAAFARTAPPHQHADLWRAVAAAALARLGTRPVWINTAGMGVLWLHVRLDDRPKYYGNAEYRRPS